MIVLNAAVALSFAMSALALVLSIIAASRADYAVEEHDRTLDAADFLFDDHEDRIAALEQPEMLVTRVYDEEQRGANDDGE